MTSMIIVKRHEPENLFTKKAQCQQRIENTVKVPRRITDEYRKSRAQNNRIIFRMLLTQPK